jgi:TolA-binding protein
MSSRTVLLLVAGLVLVASCRSSRSNRTAAARNQPTAQTTTAQSAPSAKSVLDHADSALRRVSELNQEDHEQPPMAEPPGSFPIPAQPRTPWGAPSTTAPYVPQPNLTEYGLYEAALGAYNGKRYDEAIALFSQVVTTGRPPELVPNAYYWMGESFYAMERYAEAMPYFEYVTRVGPQYKREMAIYKLSRANLHLGNHQGANMWYERLRNEYPHSTYVRTLARLGAR